MIRLRIHIDGVIHGLWTEEVALHELGPLRVRRASFVEFNDRLQCWEVREAIPRNAFRRMLQRCTGRPTGKILHRNASRTAALAWEQEHFGASGSLGSCPVRELP
jgi:hypothetical protein